MDENDNLDENAVPVSHEVTVATSNRFSILDNDNISKSRDESDDPSDNNEIFFSRKNEHGRLEDLSQREVTNMYTQSTDNIDKQTNNLCLSKPNPNSNSVSFSSSH